MVGGPGPDRPRERRDGVDPLVLAGTTSTRVTLTLPVFSEFHRAYPNATDGRSGRVARHHTAQQPNGRDREHGLARAAAGRRIVPGIHGAAFGGVAAGHLGAAVVDEVLCAAGVADRGVDRTARTKSRGCGQQREPWQVNVLAEAAALAAIADREHGRKALALVREERAWLTANLPVRPEPSCANYLFVRLPYSSAALCAHLLERKILVRDCTGTPGSRDRRCGLRCGRGRRMSGWSRPGRSFDAGIDRAAGDGRRALRRSRGGSSRRRRASRRHCSRSGSATGWWRYRSIATIRRRRRSCRKIGTYLKPNVEAIVGLRPDLVIIQARCRTPCRATGADEAAVLEVEHGIWRRCSPGIRDIAMRCGRAGAGRQSWKAEIRARLDAVRRRTAGRPRRSLVFIVGPRARTLEGLIAVGKGSYLNELIEIAGGVNALARNAAALSEALARSDARAESRTCSSIWETWRRPRASRRSRSAASWPVAHRR